MIDRVPRRFMYVLDSLTVRMLYSANKARLSGIKLNEIENFHYQHSFFVRHSVQRLVAEHSRVKHAHKYISTRIHHQHRLISHVTCGKSHVKFMIC